MTDDERKEYERTRKALFRQRKKDEDNAKENGAEEIDAILEFPPAEVEEQIDVDDSVEVSAHNEDDADIDFNNSNTASALLNIIEKSPKRKSRNVRYLRTVVINVLSNFGDLEKLDILVVLSHSLPSEVKTA